ncbi:uroporphyrinogen-III C-methyltransferase [Croceicoccus naphthovorans]|uniref:uroporphyrinogen-III C-methyltransferase n=1 Tax=Croceicoccus naphthovorans TaxID=1348774 RepID=A0A0G3XCH4_9SPHN|nr:uroporphyrinogen-III C-methyltransferase [Croceicoccus naphthovorans]AKM08897.1 uroporphyrin-III methyltransferase [Croceicoccus naphthovorans]MBB3989334.1 uroporphyrin-III C-methyltransferase [Croceicoccus naphthovorans]
MIARGEVWLVGAGPGDPDLLTRKAERLLNAASVVFYDALVGQGVLDLIPATVRREPVGKRSGRHSKDQATIDRLLVEAAMAGERVVRLKGGDPAIFGRATEEIEACRAEGIPIRICPGITAASAAAADLGISLTLRGLARKLTFVTAHSRNGAALDLDWSTLADPQATLAVYMGKEAAAMVSRELIAAGLPADTPVALVENASLGDGNRLVTRLDLLPIAAKAAFTDKPAMILIGQAMRLRATAALTARSRSNASPTDHKLH